MFLEQNKGLNRKFTKDKVLKKISAIDVMKDIKMCSILKSTNNKKVYLNENKRDIIKSNIITFNPLFHSLDTP